LWQLVNETYEPADATILKSGNIGVTVQGYDANTLKSGDIGVTVQGYDVNTAKYDHVTSNFTGNLQVSGSPVVVASKTIAGIDLIDNITATELTAALNTATQSIKGLLSAQDKERLDALYALTVEAEGQETLVDTINEVLSIFQNYPEGVNLLQELNSKAEDLNDLTDVDIVSTPPQDKQALAYDADSQKWIPTELQAIQNIDAGLATTVFSVADINLNGGNS
jgi:hypothetical protein